MSCPVSRTDVKGQLNLLRRLAPALHESGPPFYCPEFRVLNVGHGLERTLKGQAWKHVLSEHTVFAKSAHNVLRRPDVLVG
jgi:hypothetical protein